MELLMYISHEPFYELHFKAYKSLAFHSLHLVWWFCFKKPPGTLAPSNSLFHQPSKVALELKV